MWPNPQGAADLVTFTEEIFNERLHFLCSVSLPKHNNSKQIPSQQYLIFSKSTIENTRKKWEICSNLIIKTPERRQWSLSGDFIVYFERIPHLVVVFLLLTLSWAGKCRLGTIYYSHQLLFRLFYFCFLVC